MVPALLAFSFGAWLGMRFRFLVLVPAILVSIAAAASMGVAGGSDLLAILGASILAAVAVQGGYASMLVTRALTLPEFSKI